MKVICDNCNKVGVLIDTPIRKAFFCGYCGFFVDTYFVNREINLVKDIGRIVFKTSYNAYGVAKLILKRNFRGYPKGAGIVISIDETNLDMFFEDFQKNITAYQSATLNFFKNKTHYSINLFDYFS